MWMHWGLCREGCEQKPPPPVHRGEWLVHWSRAGGEGGGPDPIQGLQGWGGWRRPAGCILVHGERCLVRAAPATEGAEEEDSGTMVLVLRGCTQSADEGALCLLPRVSASQQQHLTQPNPQHSPSQGPRGTHAAPSLAAPSSFHLGPWQAPYRVSLPAWQAAAPPPCLVQPLLL